MRAKAATALPDGTTFVTEKWHRIVGIIEASVPGLPDAPAGSIYITSREWATMIAELRAKLPDAPEAFFADTSRLGYFLMGKVTVRNSGTDNERTVAMANQAYMTESRFKERAEKLISGRVQGM